MRTLLCVREVVESVVTHFDVEGEQEHTRIMDVCKRFRHALSVVDSDPGVLDTVLQTGSDFSGMLDFVSGSVSQGLTHMAEALQKVKGSDMAKEVNLWKKRAIKEQGARKELEEHVEATERSHRELLSNVAQSQTKTEELIKGMAGENAQLKAEMEKRRETHVEALEQAMVNAHPLSQHGDRQTPISKMKEDNANLRKVAKHAIKEVEEAQRASTIWPHLLELQRVSEEASRRFDELMNAVLPQRVRFSLYLPSLSLCFCICRSI